MSRKTIETVNRVEAEAERIRVDAQAKATEELNSAAAERIRLCEEAEERARATYRRESEKLQIKTTEILQLKQKAAEEEADAMEKTARMYMAQAKNLIVRRVEEQCQ